MNSKSGLILRIVAGLYLIFTGGTLLKQMLTLRPSDYVLKSVIAVVFIAVGVWYGYRNIKATYYLVKEETKIDEDDIKEDKTQVFFHKPEYDGSKYRTAPMPEVDGTKAKVEMDDTDLRAISNGTGEEELVLYHEEVEEESRKSSDNVSKKANEPEKKTSAALEQKTVVFSEMAIHVESGSKEKTDKDDSIKDPVKLAIEIMQNEDNDRIGKEAEEFESDFEEK